MSFNEIDILQLYDSNHNTHKNTLHGHILIRVRCHKNIRCVYVYVCVYMCLVYEQIESIPMVNTYQSLRVCVIMYIGMTVTECVRECVWCHCHVLSIDRLQPRMRFCANFAHLYNTDLITVFRSSNEMMLFCTHQHYVTHI